jgi:hypothetical protein
MIINLPYFLENLELRLFGILYYYHDYKFTLLPRKFRVETLVFCTIIMIINLPYFLENSSTHATIQVQVRHVFHFKQALWLHRRFLSMWWINSFPTVSSDESYHSKEATGMYHDFGTFLQNELCLLHVSTSADDEYGDFQAQATYSASYILWLKVVCELFFH